MSEDERTVAIGEAAPAPTTEMATAGPPTVPHPPPTAPLAVPTAEHEPAPSLWGQTLRCQSARRAPVTVLRLAAAG